MTASMIIHFPMLLILGGLNSFPSTILSEVFMPPGQQNQKMLVKDFLVQLGNDHNRYFTIEEGWNEGESMNAMEAHWIETSTEHAGLEQELAHLRQTVPNFTYEIDRANPQVVHIIDARLEQKKDYALEHVVHNIDFKGTAQDLVIALNKLGIPISPPYTSATNESFSNGGQVSIRAENLKVRDVLTNSIRTEGRDRRILWIARSKLERGERASIYFYGGVNN